MTLFKIYLFLFISDFATKTSQAVVAVGLCVVVEATTLSFGPYQNAAGVSTCGAAM